MEVTPPSMTAYQRALTALYLSALGHEGPVEFLDYSYASSDPARALTIRVARVRLPCEDGEDLWFSGSMGVVGTSASTGHHHFFIGVFDSADLSLPEAIGAAHHYDLAVSTLGYGHTFPIDESSRLGRVGYGACLVLDAGTYTHFEGLDLSILGMPAELFAVVPITVSERSRKMEQGLDVLLQDWDERRRDILHIALPEDEA